LWLQLGQAEVQHLSLAALDNEDVRGLDVPVHDAFRVGRIRGVGDLNGYFQ
jgi:hypothetical protein